MGNGVKLTTAIVFTVTTNIGVPELLLCNSSMPFNRILNFKTFILEVNYRSRETTIEEGILHVSEH